MSEENNEIEQEVNHKELPDTEPKLEVFESTAGLHDLSPNKTDEKNDTSNE